MTLFVDNKTGKIVKYEALARLIKESEVVSPGAFIDVSKKIKYYHKITRAILKKIGGNKSPLPFELMIVLFRPIPTLFLYE